MAQNIDAMLIGLYAGMNELAKIRTAPFSKERTSKLDAYFEMQATAIGLASR